MLAREDRFTYSVSAWKNRRRCLRRRNSVPPTRGRVPLLFQTTTNAYQPRRKRHKVVPIAQQGVWGFCGVAFHPRRSCVNYSPRVVRAFLALPTWCCFFPPFRSNVGLGRENESQWKAVFLTPFRVSTLGRRNDCCPTFSLSEILERLVV